MIETCKKIEETTKSINYVRFFITVPDWKDTYYYAALMSSPYLKFHLEFEKGKHYYIDTNDGSKKIQASFGTHLFVLACGVSEKEPFGYDKIIEQSSIIFKG